MSTANEYVSNPVDISPNDLIIRSRGFSEFPCFDESLVRFAADAIVELSDCGGTDARSAAELVCKDHPEAVLRWDREYIEEIAQLLLEADIVSLSKHYTELFAEFNARYFHGRLPPYEVRVVFDLHIVANEPVCRGRVSTGLIRLEERCIYVRYTRQAIMIDTLVHEMAHAATSGEHDEVWLKEMRRPKAVGAPIDDADVED
jgi:hypothetical protein